MTNKRLIVADEGAVLAHCLKSLLADDGYEVSTATTPDGALSLARSGAGDVLLVDAGLARSGGYSVCQALRGDPRTRDLPVVLMSAISRPVEREKGLALGADATLCKPFTLDELRKVLGSTLRRDRERTDRAHA
ncbi:response regulator [Stappia sp. F7233]|uniref:Response regulator n=1 Tax=Stappia albiluteola TaxID=2758565 RepID=A0A839ADI2_9HYPH|nr:response regulator [Stappia albiluteola]MBA5777185.1 response regulator [Stappia albiluteola]